MSLKVFLLNNKFYLLTVLLMAVILFFAVLWGRANGQNQAQAKFVGGSVSNIKQALDNFYKDQGRFPTESEFSSRQVMINYLSTVPLPQIVSSQCTQSFIYSRPTFDSYQLKFCLPSVYGTYKSGWNSISEQLAQ